jgi:hypothetical protein
MFYTLFIYQPRVSRNKMQNGGASIAHRASLLLAEEQAPPQA